MSITTAARVRSSLGIPAGVTFHDVAIGMAVDYANGVVLSALGQPGGLVATTRTDYPDVYSASQIDILLDRCPVVAIIAITNAASLMAAADYRVDSELGSVRISRGTVGSRSISTAWSDVPDDVVVSYLHGYTSATVPEKATRCADMIAVHNAEQLRHLGKTKVRNSSYGFTVDQMEIPSAAAYLLSEFQDVHHT